MFYRRNADSQLRTLLRQFDQGLASAEAVATALSRTGSGVELLEVIEKSKTANLHIDFRLGKEDTPFGPWDVDEKMARLADKVLRAHYPNIDTDIDAYDGQYVTVETWEVYKVCPELERLFGDLSIHARFLASYPTDINIPIAPELSVSFDLIAGVTGTAAERRTLTLSRHDFLANLLGPVDVVLYFGDGAIAEHKPLGRITHDALARQDYTFDGWVNWRRRYLEVARLGIPFALMGRTVDQWRIAIDQILRLSPDMPEHWVAGGSKCHFQSQADTPPLSGLCLGLAVKSSTDNGPPGLRAGSTDLIGVDSVNQAADLLTWVYLMAIPPDEGLAPEDDTADFVQAIMIHADRHGRTQVVFLGEIDWHALPNLSGEQLTAYIRRAILQEARNLDGTIDDFLWVA